jgi:hypothetical protein
MSQHSAVNIRSEQELLPSSVCVPTHGEGNMFPRNAITRVQVVISVKAIIFTFTWVKRETLFKYGSNKRIPCVNLQFVEFIRVFPWPNGECRQVHRRIKMSLKYVILHTNIMV